MEQAIAKQTFRSPYYPSPYPLLYYLSRAYSGSQSEQIAAYLLKRRRGDWWGGPLASALAVSALVRLGKTAEVGPAIARLLAAQQPNGSWPAEAFCLDPAIQKHPYYSGSAALTTALVLEALHRYKQTSQSVTVSKPAAARTESPLYQQVVAAAEQELRGLAPELRKQSLRMLELMKAGDKNREIVLLPHFFNQSLKTPLQSNSSQTLTELGLANLYGWTAYTIYDDFLDDEGDPALLSVATSSLRYSLRHFARALPADHDFLRVVDETFDIIDGANQWEVSRARFKIKNQKIMIGRLPNYSGQSLADRSIGHTLTPLGVLAAAGASPGSPQATAIREALTHYLIARQLNDDLHDWEEDVRMGRISYVVAAILQEMSVPPGTQQLSQLIPKMQRHFWHHTLVSCCKTITKHTILSRQAAASSQLLVEPNILTTLLDGIDESVQKTLAEQAKAEKFLAAYRDSGANK